MDAAAIVCGNFAPKLTVFSQREHIVSDTRLHATVYTMVSGLSKTGMLCTDEGFLVDYNAGMGHDLRGRRWNRL